MSRSGKSVRGSGWAWGVPACPSFEGPLALGFGGWWKGLSLLLRLGAVHQRRNLPPVQSVPPPPPHPPPHLPGSSPGSSLHLHSSLPVTTAAINLTGQARATPTLFGQARQIPSRLITSSFPFCALFFERILVVDVGSTARCYSFYYFLRLARVPCPGSFSDSDIRVGQKPHPMIFADPNTKKQMIAQHE